MFRPGDLVQVKFTKPFGLPSNNHNGKIGLLVRPVSGTEYIGFLWKVLMDDRHYFYYDCLLTVISPAKQ